MDNIIKRYETNFKTHPDLPALTDYASGKTYTYRHLAAKVADNHKFFDELGIAKGDKVALIGKNSIDWVCVYISVITYGAVIVPILADFNPIDMIGIINHSDSKVLFTDKSILEKIGTSQLTQVRKIFCLEEMVDPRFEDFDINSIHYAEVDDEDTLIISYTSGTTGTSKGVMLPVRSITNNVQFALDHNFHFEGSRVLGLLPLAHAYGCAFDMLTPLSVGSHVYVLGKIPSPKVLLEALSKVKPHLICTVPLVMEKLVRKNIFPILQKPSFKVILSIPLLNKIIHNSIRKKLMESFGGSLREVNMGGAALSPDIESFLKRIKFPFTMGYGMTECGPLISYDTWRDFKSSSCGTILTGMEVKVETEGFEKGVGEICVKGVNVMTGYYKNPEATSKAIIDGWLHTGDVGYIDEKCRIFLRGRCKNMILSPSGQNIYPEEIESKLNNLEAVAESVVCEEKGKLIALVYPDPDKVKKNGWDSHQLKTLMQENLTALNGIVGSYEKVHSIRICLEPFEKTPKQSIKRFLYPAAAKLAE